MSNSRVIMVTGVASFWGSQLSHLLLENSTHRLIGVDRQAPALPPHEKLDFVRADTRNPLLAELLLLEEVDTVYFLDQPDEAGWLLAGLKNLMTVCAQAGVKHLIWLSSTAVYGPLPTNAAFISEDQSPYTKAQGGPLLELVTAEQTCFDFARHHENLTISVLRVAHVVGSQAPSPFNQYLAGPSAPLLLGFDPMLQLAHEQDVLAALWHALEAEPVTTVAERMPPNLHHYNIASEGLMPLTRLLSLTKTLPLPLFHPLAYWGASLLHATPWQLDTVIPYDWDFLRYRCVGATERQAAWGFAPRHSAEDAARALALHKASDDEPPPSDMALDQLRLKQTLAQRRQTKEQA
jgi:UDP-glucose 4-epimerase